MLLYTSKCWPHLLIQYSSSTYSLTVYEYFSFISKIRMAFTSVHLEVIHSLVNAVEKVMNPLATNEERQIAHKVLLKFEEKYILKFQSSVICYQCFPLCLVLFLANFFSILLSASPNLIYNHCTCWIVTLQIASLGWFHLYW